MTTDVALVEARQIAGQDRATTTSLLVAKYFDRQHFHVIRDIENLDPSSPSKFGWATTEEQRELQSFFNAHFIKSLHTDAQGKPRPMYIMDRDGWTLLVMGYQGPKAMIYKTRYIRQFDEMAAALRADNAALKAEIKEELKRELLAELSPKYRRGSKPQPYPNPQLEAHPDAIDAAWAQLISWVEEHRGEFKIRLEGVDKYGHWRDGKGLFISVDAFKTALSGHDVRACAKAFAKRGWIGHNGTDNDIRIQGQTRIAGTRARGYWLQIEQ